MSVSTIKEFLISLGYKVDSSSERRFVGGVNNATDVVNKLGSALKVLTAGATVYGAVKWMDNLSKGMESMFYAAQRTGSGVRQLQAFGYAASQMGSSVEQAMSSAQALHQWMVNNPASEAILRQNLRIDTRDANGEMASGEEVLQRVGKSMQNMPAWRQNTISQQLGLPLELRQALLQQGQMQAWEEQYNAMLRKAGLDPDKAATNGKNFAQGARSLMSAFSIAGDAIGASLMGHDGATGALGRFRDMLLEHVPQITTILSKLADAGVKAFGHMLDYLAGVDWDHVFKKIGDFFSWLTGLDAKTMLDGLKKIAEIFAVIFGVSLIANVVSLVGALSGLIPVFAGIAAGITTAVAAASAVIPTAAVAGAGDYVGTKAGEWLKEKALNDERGRIFQGNVHRGLLGIFASLGNQRAKEEIVKIDSGQIPKYGTTDIFSKEPLGVRNQNGGNMRVPGSMEFQKFATPQDGLNAMGHQLLLYFTGQSAAAGHKRLQSVHDIISKWSPASENGEANTDAYIAEIAANLGVRSDANLNLKDPVVLAKLMAAMVHHEQGKNPYSSEMLINAAHQNLDKSDGGGATLTADTTINVYGTKDPATTAQAVANQQNHVNQRLVRDLKPAMS